MMMSDYDPNRDYYKRKNGVPAEGCKEMDQRGPACAEDCKIVENKFKKTKECGFINVTDPKIRKQLMDTTKCPGDATNFTFWFSKVEPDHWGLTIKSIPKKSSPNDYEKQHGMIFNSQHTWKITWYRDGSRLKVAMNSKSLAEDIVGKDFTDIDTLFSLYKDK